MNVWVGDEMLYQYVFTAISITVVFVSSRRHRRSSSRDDDVGLHVLGCRVDILGTNCTSSSRSSSIACIPCCCIMSA